MNLKDQVFIGCGSVVRAGGVCGDGGDEDRARLQNSRRIRLMKLLKSPCRFKDSVSSGRLGIIGSHWITSVKHIQLVSRFCRYLFPSIPTFITMFLHQVDHKGEHFIRFTLVDQCKVNFQVVVYCNQGSVICSLRISVHEKLTFNGVNRHSSQFFTDSQVLTQLGRG